VNSRDLKAQPNIGLSLSVLAAWFFLVTIDQTLDLDGCSISLDVPVLYLMENYLKRLAKYCLGLQNLWLSM
jgi:hypothetical protein